MEFTEHNTYHGFNLKQKSYNEELRSDIYIFEHTVLKNNLIALKNSDENKCYCIGFKTPPSDSTGVPHILEHSVLSGSKRFPVRDVFSELVKGSLTTFLNAMTYSDKTIYPFSTRNEKEYFNLMQVYSDLVLNPLMEKETFQQEGWHLSLKEKGGKLAYNGIVLNEMKGAYSDPLRKMWDRVCTWLMPESTYSHSSGGYPENIPELTYEMFCDFHRRYYHPSNSTVVVYGNAPLEKELELLNTQFFSHFEFLQSNAAVVMGKELDKMAEIEEYYPAGSEDAGVYLGYGIETGVIDNPEKNIAFEILNNILLNSEASLMKKNLLDAEVGTEIGSFYNDTLRSFLFVYALGSSVEKKGKFLEVWKTTLKELVEKGIDRELLVSEINSFEFYKKELSSSAKRGMEYTIDTISAHLYGIDLLENFQFDQVIQKIRKEALENRYFEKLIEEYLLDTSHSCLYLMLPDPKKGEKDLKEFEQKMASMKGAMGEAELEETVKKTAHLAEVQSQPNPEEKLKLLPRLSIGDISPEKHIFDFSEEKISGVPYWITRNQTNGIIYLYFGFTTDHIPEEYLPYLTLLSQIVTELGTPERNFEKLANDTGIYTGGISSDFHNYSRHDEPEQYHPYIWFSMKLLDRFFKEGFEVFSDILLNTIFENPKRLKVIIERTFSSMQYSISSEGYYLALNRIYATLSKKGVYNEKVQGYSQYQLISALDKEVKKSADHLIAKLKETARLLIGKNNLVIHLNSEEKHLGLVKPYLEEFIAKLAETNPGGGNRLDYGFPLLPKNGAFATPAEVVYAGIGGNIFRAGLNYSGAMEVLRKYLDRDYLYNQIRVQGGAYGNFSRLSRYTGDMSFISYRDPNVAKTYAAYRSIPGVVRNFALSEYALEQIKISAYAGFDPLMSAAQKGAKARNDHIHGLTPEDTLQTIEEILAVTPASIASLADGIETFFNDTVVGIIGNSEKIKEESSLFSEIIQVQ